MQTTFISLRYVTYFLLQKNISPEDLQGHAGFLILIARSTSGAVESIVFLGLLIVLQAQSVVICISARCQKYV